MNSLDIRKDAERRIQETLGDRAEKLSGKIVIQNGAPFAENLFYSTSSGKYQVVLTRDKVILLDESGNRVSGYGVDLEDNPLLSVKTQRLLNPVKLRGALWYLNSFRWYHLLVLSIGYVMVAMLASLMAGLIISLLPGVSFEEGVNSSIRAFAYLPFIALLLGWILLRLTGKSLVSDLRRSGYTVISGPRAEFDDDKGGLLFVSAVVINAEKDDQPKTFYAYPDGKVHFDSIDAERLPGDFSRKL